MRVTSHQSFDAIVVGGGPAGSECARVLVRGGLRTLVLDRQRFPRVKLCGGWLSPSVWDVLELLPRAYPASVWEWSRCHVQYAGTCHTVPGRGYFIRRYEFDAFLLDRSGAEVVQHHVRGIEQQGGSWVVDATYSAPILIGAGGTHCVVARSCFEKKRTSLVAAQENEFLAGAEQVAKARLGRDGEPELLLHADLGGYSWNVPKGEWLNVGSGTSEPREVLTAWTAARDFFVAAGHIPASATARLDEVKGHSYYLFDSTHLADCEQRGILIVGDALGLAHPLTAEGILPSVLSGQLAAEAVLAGNPGSYRTALQSHALMRDYELARELLVAGIALKRRFGGRAPRVPALPGVSRVAQAALARGFARMFSGQPIPYAGVLRAALRGARALTEARTQ